METAGCYKLEVRGTFAARIDMQSVHCGPHGRPVLSFPYEVTIVADGLDDNGFVIDNMDVRRYFDAMHDVNLTCEKLCHKACEELYRPNFKFVTVRIHGTDFASVSCTKTRPQNWSRNHDD